MMNMGDGSEYDQMGAAAGIKKHGAKAVAAIIKEYEQLKEMETVRPGKQSELTNKERSDTLELLTLIKKETLWKDQG